MPQTDVIREFLVKLGFQVDKDGLGRFGDGVEGATKTVAGLVAGIEAAAFAIGSIAHVFATNAEQIYFQAKRVGSGASDLKAFGNAAQNLGVDIGEAVGNVESLASAIRKNPGTESMINSLGVQTRTANGQLRDTVDIMTDLGKQLAQKDQWQGLQYAGMLGISERTFLAITDPSFGRELERQRGLLADAGFDKAAQGAHDFEVKLRSLETRIQAVGTVILSSLIDAIGPQMDEATKLFEKNSDKISSGLTTVSTGVVNTGSIMLPIIGTIAEGWRLIYELVKDTGIEINKILPKGWGDKIGAGTSWIFEKLGIADAVYNMATGSKSPSGKKSTVSSDDKGVVSKLMDYGWSREQAVGIAANLKRESDYNPGAIGDNGQAYGIAQWHPDRQAAFKKFSGHDIKDSTLDEQLAFVNYELTLGAEKQAGAMLRAANNARQAGDIVSRYYERPAAEDAEASTRGDMAMQMSQKTTININGAGDPVAVGSAVATEQNQVNANLARNMKTAVQ